MIHCIAWNLLCQSAVIHDSIMVVCYICYPMYIRLFAWSLFCSPCYVLYFSRGTILAISVSVRQLYQLGCHKPGGPGLMLAANYRQAYCRTTGDISTGIHTIMNRMPLFPSWYWEKTPEVRTFELSIYSFKHNEVTTLIAGFMGPTWGPYGADRTEVGPMLAPWTRVVGQLCICESIYYQQVIQYIYICKYVHNAYNSRSMNYNFINHKAVL